MARVTGLIRFAELRGPIRNATVYVRVEDASLADAAAVRLGEQVLRGVDVDPGGPPVPFAVAAAEPPPRARCTVRVLVDLDGDGALGRGDWASRQGYPVLGRAGAGPVDVVVREIP